jgi:hypothetical protein
VLRVPAAFVQASAICPLPRVIAPLDSSHHPWSLQSRCGLSTSTRPSACTPRLLCSSGANKRPVVRRWGICGHILNLSLAPSVPLRYNLFKFTNKSDCFAVVIGGAAQHGQQVAISIPHQSSAFRPSGFQAFDIQYCSSLSSCGKYLSSWPKGWSSLKNSLIRAHTNCLLNATLMSKA